MTFFYYWLLSSNDTNYTKLFCFDHQMNQMNLMAGAMYCLVKSGASGDYFQTFFVPFVVSVGKIIVSCWINFCPRSPKPMNSYNSLIIIDITSYIPIKSPKIHPKSLLLYINFANFLSYPFSKLPDPNDVVSSINAYGVNSWQLIGYKGWEKATDERKKRYKKPYSCYFLDIFCSLRSYRYIKNYPIFKLLIDK